MVHFELGRTGWPSRMRYLPRALHDREPPIPAPFKVPQPWQRSERSHWPGSITGVGVNIRPQPQRPVTEDCRC